MGGEEFLITLFDTSQAEALAFAENIRNRVEQNKVVLTNKNTIGFTISVGVYQVSHQENIEQALAHVDEALYKAKRNGRNQVAL
jgi:diguanylate cyclase (GGDEF)-like protein